MNKCDRGMWFTVFCRFCCQHTSNKLQSSCLISIQVVGIYCGLDHVILQHKYNNRDNRWAIWVWLVLVSIDYMWLQLKLKRGKKVARQYKKKWTAFSGTIRVAATIEIAIESYGQTHLLFHRVFYLLYTCRQWNHIIKRLNITKPSYNKVLLLVPALYISSCVFFYLLLFLYCHLILILYFVKVCMAMHIFLYINFSYERGW